MNELMSDQQQSIDECKQAQVYQYAKIKSILQIFWHQLKSKLLLLFIIIVIICQVILSILIIYIDNITQYHIITQSQFTFTHSLIQLSESQLITLFIQLFIILYFYIHTMTSLFLNRILQHSSNKLNKLKHDIHQLNIKHQQSNNPTQHQQSPNRPKNIFNTQQQLLNKKTTLHSTQQKNSMSPIKLKKNIDQQIKKTQQKRRLLLSELKQVDTKISIMLKQKEQLQKKVKESDENNLVQKTQKALQLVKRMNRQRKQKQLKRLKEEQIRKKALQKSQQKMSKQKQREQQQKNERRRVILQKIQDSKSKRQLLLNLNKKTNKMIVQIEKNKEQRIFNQTQINSIQQKIIKSKTDVKKYPKTHFLKVLQEQQKIKKIRQDIKQRQKFLMLQKRKSYNLFTHDPLAFLINKNIHRNIQNRYHSSNQTNTHQKQTIKISNPHQIQQNITII